MKIKFNYDLSEDELETIWYYFKRYKVEEWYIEVYDHDLIEPLWKFLTVFFTSAKQSMSIDSEGTFILEYNEF
jgi:hypothetical protein